MRLHDAECGCSITPTYDWGDLSYIIGFCPLHRAAPDLLKMLRYTRWFLMSKARRDPEERNVVDELADAISKATQDA